MTLLWRLSEVQREGLYRQSPSITQILLGVWERVSLKRMMGEMGKAFFILNA